MIKSTVLSLEPLTGGFCLFLNSLKAPAQVQQDNWSHQMEIMLKMKMQNSNLLTNHVRNL